MLNFTLLQNLLIIAIACSTITVLFIQKTKQFLPNSKLVVLYGLIVNLGFGYLFCQTFSNIDYVKALWVGLFSFLGADTIYKGLEGNLAPYSKLINNKNTTNNTDNNTTNNNENTTNNQDNTANNNETNTSTNPKPNDIIGDINYE